MNIYLVRHGQTDLNISPNVQGASGSLNDTGRKQAEFLAQKLAHIPIEHILCSPLERTRETAEIINKQLHKPIEFSDLLKENRNPNEIIEQPENSEKILAIRRAISENFQVPGWRYSDEENFDDLKNRGQKALELFSNACKENLLVVTHGLFMRVIMATVIMGPELTAREYQHFPLATLTKNTGITVLKMHEGLFEGRVQKRWVLVTWNDHAHLENV